MPWVQPWSAVSAPLGLPRNAATSRAYSGINILILWIACIEHGFTGQNWLTFRQALKIGAHMRKGENPLKPLAVLLGETPEGLRLHDIAAAAGVSHPLILHHFGSRAGLVRALTREAIIELRDKQVAAMSERDPFGDDFLAAAGAPAAFRADFFAAGWTFLSRPTRASW